MNGKVRVYVAGPISHGDLMLNIRAAVQAADELLDAGFAPYVPHWTCFWHLISPREYGEWMKYDAEWLACCQAVFRVLGHSPGADRECLQARRLGIPVFFDLASLQDYFQGE